MKPTKLYYMLKKALINRFKNPEDIEFHDLVEQYLKSYLIEQIKKPSTKEVYKIIHTTPWMENEVFGGGSQSFENSQTISYIAKIIKHLNNHKSYSNIN